MGFVDNAREKIRNTYSNAKRAYESDKANRELRARERAREKHERQMAELTTRLELQKERRKERQARQELEKLEREEKEYRFNHSIAGKAINAMKGGVKTVKKRNRSGKSAFDVLSGYGGRSEMPGIMRMSSKGPRRAPPRRRKKKKAPRHEPDDDLPGIMRY